MSGPRGHRRQPGTPRAAALKLATAYVVIAGVWIVGSDALVALLPQAIAESLQTAKGLLFVGVTALALFVLMLRWEENVKREAHHAQSAEHLLAQVVDTVPVGVMLISDEGLITFLNPSAEYLLGVSAAVAVGRRLDELGVFDHVGEITSITDLLRAGAGGGLSLKTTEEGVARAVIARAAEIDKSEAGAGWVVAVADVTDAHDARERSARLVQGYQYLSQAAVAMSRVGSRRALLDEVARLAVERGGFVGAWALYQDASGREEAGTGFLGAGGEVCVETEHIAAAYTPQSELLMRLVSGEIVVSNDLARDPRNPWYSAAGPAGLGASAVLALDAPGGRTVLLTLFATEPGYFDADQVELLQSIRSSLAFAVNRLALDSQRLDAEQALAHSEHSYRMLFAIHPQPMWVYDTQTLAFLAVNDAAIAKYGYTREEFAAMTIADIRPRNEVPRLLNNVLHVADGFDDAGIWTHLDKNGRAFPVHIYSHVTDWEGRSAELVMVMEVARVE